MRGGGSSVSRGLFSAMSSRRSILFSPGFVFPRLHPRVILGKEFRVFCHKVAVVPAPPSLGFYSRIFLFTMASGESSQGRVFFSSFALQTRCFGQTSQIQFGPSHLSWLVLKEISFLPQFVPDRGSVVADALSRPIQVIGVEWTLHQEVFVWLRKRWPVMIDLFTSSLNHRCGIFFFFFFFSPVSDPMSAGSDAMLQSWDFLQAYAFLPFAMIPQVLGKLRSSLGAILTLIVPFYPQEWFPDLLNIHLGHPLPFQTVGICCASRTFEGSIKTSRALASCLATVQWFVRASGFSLKVGGRLGCSRRPSSVANYQQSGLCIVAGVRTQVTLFLTRLCLKRLPIFFGLGRSRSCQSLWSRPTAPCCLRSFGLSLQRLGFIISCGTCFGLLRLSVLIIRNYLLLRIWTSSCVTSYLRLTSPWMPQFEVLDQNYPVLGGSRHYQKG